MRSRLLPLIIALVGLGVSADAARAGYEFRFADSSGTFTNSFSFDATVTPTVDIRVYLVQTGGDTGLSATGLVSSGVKLSYGGTVANVAGPANVFANAAFDDTPNKTVTATEAALRQATDVNPPVKTLTTGPDANRVLIGTFRFTGLAVGSELTLTVDPNAAPVGNNVLDDGTVLDALIANDSAVITVTNVPEPGTMVLAGLLATGIGGAGLRRLRPSVAV